MITLNRPKSKNSLSSGLISDLYDAYGDIDSDNEIKSLIITGGEKVFAAGADIKEIATLENPVEGYAHFRKYRRSFDRLASLNIPVIGAVSGFALGGGCELAMACDYRIASDSARFGLPEVNLGVIPGGGGTQRLPRLVGAGRAFEMLYTGEQISAQRAWEIGLVNKVVPAGELIAAAKEAAVEISKKPGFAIKMIKTCIKRGLEMDLESAMDYESRCFEMLFSTNDRAEGVKAFSEKRKPVFKGC
jgi:enoyl-CoA hydratase